MPEKTREYGDIVAEYIFGLWIMDLYEVRYRKPDLWSKDYNRVKRRVYRLKHTLNIR